MTSRLLAGALAALVIAVAAGACDDGTIDGYWSGGDSCNQYASCGACTPVQGCGWCTTGVGQGMCASDPNECARAPSFSWTWDPSGCFAPTDAGSVTTTDAAASSSQPPPNGDAGSSTTDAGATLVDAAEGPVDAASPGIDASDAASAGD
jgi:hypothetical protein